MLLLLLLLGSPTSTSIAIATITTDRACNLFSTANDSGITNTVLIVICICLIVIVLVIVGFAFVIKKLYKSPSCEQQQNTDNDRIPVKVGDNTIFIRKSRMTNFKDFFDNIETIMQLTIQELDSDNVILNNEIIQKARKLKAIMINWQVDDPPNRIQFDSLSPLSQSYELLPIPNLMAPPQASNGIISYYNTDVADNNKKNDILSLLLPTLAEKIDNERKEQYIQQ